METTIIVLHTSGKWDDVDFVKVKLFKTIEEAEKYCIENTDESKDQKYWNFAEIIEDGVKYEVCKYENIE